MIKFIGNIINKVMKLFSYDAANDWQQHPEYPWMEINGNLVWRVNMNHTDYWKGFAEKYGAAFDKLNKPSKVTEDYMKEKDKGIPYDVVGNGVMTAKAEDVRKYAKHQFDAAGQITIDKTMDDALVALYLASKEQLKVKQDNYFKKVINGDDHIIYKTPKQILELAIKICEDYSEDKYKLYKGYHPYKGNEPERAWEYTEGMCDGASQCADKLKELLEELNK